MNYFSKGPSPDGSVALATIRGYTPEQLQSAGYIEELAIELGRLAYAQRLRHLVTFTWQTAYEAHHVRTGKTPDKAAFDVIFFG